MDLKILHVILVSGVSKDLSEKTNMFVFNKAANQCLEVTVMSLMFLGKIKPLLSRDNAGCEDGLTLTHDSCSA